MSEQEHGKLEHGVVRTWVQLIDGSFNVRDIWNDLGIITPENRQYLRIILKRLEAEGLIVKLPKSGQYRKLDSELEPIDWESADVNNIYPIELPFNIHKHCKIYPKSIIILAGEKNAGKTAFLYETIYRNMDNLPVDLFNSETGREQMKERFEPLCVPKPAPFKVYERYDNFADVIHPEHLSVIDYLDLNSEVYMVGAEIDAIFRKLTTGTAIIALQKPPATVTYTARGEKKVHTRDLAYGGAFSAKRAALYVSLGARKCKLVYVKTPKKNGVNPNNMMWSYTFTDDGYFANIARFIEPDL